MPEGVLFDLPGLLHACNPGWRAAGGTAQPTPVAHAERLSRQLLADAAPAAALVEGSRQTGKSTLLDAVAERLLAELPTATAVCRLRLADTPLRWCEVDAIYAAWQAASPCTGRHFLLIDDVDLWSAKRQGELIALVHRTGVQLLVACTRPGSLPDLLLRSGRSPTRVHLRPANFAEFLAFHGQPAPLPVAPQSLRLLFDWSAAHFRELGDGLRPLQLQFLRYLAHGGYPGARTAASPEAAQRYLREEVVTRHLRWDAPACDGVRRGSELELTLAYLAARSGSLLDIPDLCAHLSVERPTARQFITLLESMGLLQRIAPLGYGHQVRRARFLICLADPALPAALLWQSISDPQVLECAGHHALQRHLRGAYATRGAEIRFATIKPQQHTLIVGAGAQCLPFALQFAPRRSRGRDFGAVARLCTEHGVARAYLATRLGEDIGPLNDMPAAGPAVMRVPLALLCLWLSAAEPDGFNAG